MFKAVRWAIIVLAAGMFLLSCRDNPGSVTSPTKDRSLLLASRVSQDVPDFPTDPNDFIVGITNPYLNFEPGTVFTYVGETDECTETIIVEVLTETKEILGVQTTVVHDQVFCDDELIEDTYDWYAEDIYGNVWYFGEATVEYEDGVPVSTEGSWEAGVDGALPGIIMLAEPRPGLTYRQEFAEDVAEDMARVVGPPSATVEVPYGTFDDAIRIMEWNPLETHKPEFKYFVAGVGLVLEVHPGGERVELVSIE